MLIKMQKEDWLIGPRIGDKSGFGTVFRGQSPTRIGAVKLVPKEKGAERELLFVDLAGKPNVIPVIDWGKRNKHGRLLCHWQKNHFVRG